MLRLLTILIVVVSCTDKPDAAAPSDPNEQTASLAFSGLSAQLQHNVQFAVGVTLNGDISTAAGDATQALTIILSKRAGTGSWQKVGEQVAANDRASFNLTLPAGQYTLKAESAGRATLSQESSAFTVAAAGEVSEGVDGVKLSFVDDEDTIKKEYEIKQGALFDVTLKITEYGKLADDSAVTLHLLKDDGSKTGMLMQWQQNKKDMQLPGTEISAKVDEDDGKAEFKELFIVDDSDVAKLQATLPHDGKTVSATAGYSRSDGERKLTGIQYDKTTTNVIEITTEPAAQEPEPSTSIYFFNDSVDPATIDEHSGSGGRQSVSNNSIKLNEHCYDLAVKFHEYRYAFLQRNVGNGNPDCK